MGTVSATTAQTSPMLALSTPFSSPTIALFDLLRIFTVLAVGAMTQGTGLRRSERVRRFGIGAVVLTIAGSRVQNLGEPARWQLAAGAVGIALLGWAELRRIRKEPA